MRTSNTRERLIWLSCGVLLIAWALGVAANFGIHDPWQLMPGGGVRKDTYWPLVMASATILAAVLLAWLFYSLGSAELRKQATAERQFRVAMEEAYRGTLHALTAVLDLRDDETYGHSRRVMGLSLAIGKRLGLSREELQILAWGALLHDLGKIGIRDGILLKPGPLTPDERADMNQHVIIGQQIVLNVPFLARSAGVVRHHHERWDGGGYPDRLKGEETPLLARIFTVADAFDAMTSSRPYRPVPLDVTRARDVIHMGAGAQFCPTTAGAFLLIPGSELDQIRRDSLQPGGEFTALDHLAFSGQDATTKVYQDALTGVYNRTAWEATTAAMAQLRGTGLGTVVFVDMDRLKEINDRYGHLTGDRVLVDLATRLGQTAEKVYRFGGDEFVLWFQDGRWNQGTERKLDDVLARFQEYWTQLMPDISVSWGVASSAAHTQDIRTLLAEADEAMYRRKRQRRRDIRAAT